MSRYLLLFLGLFGCFASLAQRSQNPVVYFNSPAFWSHVKMDDPAARPQLHRGDTAIIMASTRVLQRDSLRCIGEVRDDGQIRYFMVYAAGGNWWVHRVSSLEAAVASMPDQEKDWVIYTEGMGKIFTNNADRGMQMAAQYGVNVLLLDYPSIRTNVGSLHNYRFSIRNARDAYEDFVPVLDTFKQLRKEGKAGNGHLSLFFHSMGNYVMRQIVRENLLYRYNNEVWVDNIVLNAPCVPRRRHQQWVDKIAFAKRIFIHYNPKDATLKWGRLAAFHQVLGEHVKRPLSDNAVYINFNRLCGDGHSNFLSLYGRPPALREAITHYSLLFHGSGLPLNNTHVYVPSTYRHIGLMIIPAN